MVSSADMAMRQEKNQKVWKSYVSSARIAHRFRPFVLTNGEMSF